ncbi:MAG: 2-oxoacid:ferredoxin oxidoreductase subunit beta [Candidatus Krumholzibacteria bacterium]|nr:2-oxoacid:ferredoxin oxidoreductase subunit beta [Candidatus Krumholzibacteria bacterium]MDH4336587.1 2-oxoacid:ferredoxin oxidoreductase subunit beta [Candidatus Krumholzibacteria bacterium]MDH5270189.1 2-oxoacid:ferredoxin oxidoreductase subunit beta [Candidatus Krumholzibacteria bacterium]MDH5627144.1 2-oxoacid:ferredoxin oxidoreductase subunit beta [Candidatus Krumholzibacteria bacterium]
MTQTIALKPKDYKNDVEPIWCPGCGDFGDLAAFTQALAAMQLDPKDIAIVSGIGCSGRFSHFIKSYAYHTAHGRALPTAIGVKAANPDLKVFVVGGDGDGLSIGGGHIPHAARRNPDITYMILDNAIYGLTKGQGSPTSPLNMVTPTTPFGLEDPPLDPLRMFLAYGVSFVARGFSSDVKGVARLIQAGAEHRGFALILLVSPCPTFNQIVTFDFMKSVVAPIPDDHDPTDLSAAFQLALSKEKFYTGVFYRNDGLATMDAKLEHQRRLTMDKQPRTLEALFAQF